MKKEMPVKMVTTVKLSNAERLVGKCVILWRNMSMHWGKVLRVKKAQHKILYEVLSGADKGVVFESIYDSTHKTIKAYHEIMAATYGEKFP